MGRASVKKDKTPYQLAREELDLTRQEAEDLLRAIPAERLEKIENDRLVPRPDDVIIMAREYKKPALLNYYCSHTCPIGKLSVPMVQVKELPSIIIEMLSSLNAINRKKDTLIDIAADGQLGEEEIEDFIDIQEKLERISMSVESLQLWAETLLADGTIDTAAYHEIKEKRREKAEQKKKKQ